MKKIRLQCAVMGYLFAAGLGVPLSALSHSADSAAVTLPQPAPQPPGMESRPHGPRGAGPARPSHGGGALRRADANADGVVTRSEFENLDRAQRERRARRFEAADRNADGQVTREELRALRDDRRPAPVQVPGRVSSP